MGHRAAGQLGDQGFQPSVLAVAGPGKGAPEAERSLLPLEQVADIWFPAVGTWFLLLWIGSGAGACFPVLPKERPLMETASMTSRRRLLPGRPELCLARWKPKHSGFSLQPQCGLGPGLGSAAVSVPSSSSDLLPWPPNPLSVSN